MFPSAYGTTPPMLANRPNSANVRPYDTAALPILALASSTGNVGSNETPPLLKPP